eukprot:3863878-Amphidinium_carterae.4
MSSCMASLNSAEMRLTMRGCSDGLVQLLQMRHVSHMVVMCPSARARTLAALSNRYMVLAEAWNQRT